MLRIIFPALYNGLGGGIFYQGVSFGVSGSEQRVWKVMRRSVCSARTLYVKIAQVLQEDKREACKIKRGPAAVTGDENHKKPLCRDYRDGKA